MLMVSEPLVLAKEIEYVNECLQTGWISSSGHFISDFEQSWAQYCRRKHGIAVSNGTTALEAAVKVLELPAGSEIILPSFTIISCALAVLEANCKPVLVDCDPETWCMDVNQIEAKITEKTKAIMVVHIYGQPVDMDPICSLAQRYQLKIIEDAAEVHGATYKGQVCGSFGEISCFSFFANKIITTGEGGMVLTDDDELAQRLRDERNLAFRPEKRFLHTKLGHNYRLTNMQAALGLAQVETIALRLEKKAWLGNTYNQLLADLPQIQLPTTRPWATNVYWMYGLVLRDETKMDAVQFADLLKEKGIETRPFFLGMHEQPVFQARGLFLNEKYPVTTKIARQGLYLPSGLNLREEDLKFVSNALHQIFAQV